MAKKKIDLHALRTSVSANIIKALAPAAGIFTSRDYSDVLYSVRVLCDLALDDRTTFERMADGFKQNPELLSMLLAALRPLLGIDMQAAAPAPVNPGVVGAEPASHYAYAFLCLHKGDGAGSTKIVILSDHVPESHPGVAWVALTNAVGFGDSFEAAREMLLEQLPEAYPDLVALYGLPE